MSLAISDPLKKQLEGTVVSEFLLAMGNPYKVLRDGIPPEPDKMCEQHGGTGRQVGIEVVTVYYDQNHAKSVWLEAREGKSLSYEIRRKDSVENDRLLAESSCQIGPDQRHRDETAWQGREI